MNNVDVLYMFLNAITRLQLIEDALGDEYDIDEIKEIVSETRRKKENMKCED